MEWYNFHLSPAAIVKRQNHRKSSTNVWYDTVWTRVTCELAKKNYCDLYWRSVCVFWCLFVLQNIVQRGRCMEQQKLGESCFGSMCVCFYVLRSQSTPSTGAGKTPMDRFTTRFITWNPLCAHGHNFQASKKNVNKVSYRTCFFGRSLTHCSTNKQMNECVPLLF